MPKLSALVHTVFERVNIIHSGEATGVGGHEALYLIYHTRIVGQRNFLVVVETRVDREGLACRDNGDSRAKLTCCC